MPPIEVSKIHTYAAATWGDDYGPITATNIPQTRQGVVAGDKAPKGHWDTAAKL